MINNKYINLQLFECASALRSKWATIKNSSKNAWCWQKIETFSADLDDFSLLNLSKNQALYGLEMKKLINVNDLWARSFM